MSRRPEKYLECINFEKFDIFTDPFSVQETKILVDITLLSILQA